MRQRYKKQFYLNPKERKGLQTLVLCIVLVYVTGQIYPLIAKKKKLDNTTLDRMHIEWQSADSVYQQERKSKWKKPWEKKDYDGKSSYEKRTRQKPQKLAASKRERFDFDPNTMSKDSLQLLGFSSKTISNIINYRNKGGTIKTADELKKIYGIDTSLVGTLESHLSIKEVEKTKYAEEKKPRPKALATIEEIFININTADIYQWMQLKGIGETKAKIIVDYRESVGGFHSVEQLQEVWGITDTLYLEIAPQLLEDNSYRRIAINTATKEELAQHRYINYKKAGIIVAYRNNHGPYHSAADLEKNRAFRKDFVDRLNPYVDYSTGYPTTIDSSSVTTEE